MKGFNLQLICFGWVCAFGCFEPHMMNIITLYDDLLHKCYKKKLDSILEAVSIWLLWAINFVTKIWIY